VLMMTAESMWRPAGELVDSVRTGSPSFDRIFGNPFFDYHAAHPESTEVFDQGMAAYSGVENGPVAAAYAFPPVATVVDVGGGQGGFLLEVLRANPGLHGVLFDREHVVSGHRLDTGDVAGRWEVVAGDFLERVPPADVYLVKRIMHDWDDDSCVRILENCRRALRPGGRVLVVDAVIPAGNEPHQGKALDLLMMAILTGHERTEAQFARLCGAAGLRLDSVTQVPGMPVAIVDAVDAVEATEIH
jgi:SAM-dependent methyltransferase